MYLTGVGLIGDVSRLEACATEAQISFPADRNGVIFLCQSAFDEGFLLADLWRRFLAPIVYWPQIFARSPVVNHGAIGSSHVLTLFLAVRSCRVLG